MTRARRIVRFGDQQIFQAQLAAGAFSFLTNDLVRIYDSPFPANWSVMGLVSGVDPANLATVDFNLLVTVGVGSHMDTIVSPLLPGIVAQFPDIAGQVLIVKLQAAGTVAVAGTWRFSAWAAPVFPYEGSKVSLDDGQ